MMESENVHLLACGNLTGTLRLCSSQPCQQLVLLCNDRNVLQVNGRSYYMPPFTFLILSFEKTHLTVEAQKSAGCLYLHLQCTEMFLQHMNASGLTMEEPHTLSHLSVIKEIWQFLQPVTGTALENERGQYALQLLLCLLFEGTDGAATKAVEVPHYNKLTQLRHDIYQYPAESWFIQDICDNLGISRPYFHKLYVAAFGTTCTQDVIASRISYSKELLEETEESISFISQQCGFESDVYFMRKFKQHVGMTPTAYRRIYKKSTVTVKNSTEKKRR